MPSKNQETKIIAQPHRPDAQTMLALEQEFQQMIALVNKLREDEQEFKSCMEQIKAFEQKRHTPLKKAILDEEVRLVHALDEALSAKIRGVSRSDWQTIEEILEDNLATLLFEHRRDDIAPLFAKCFGYSATEAFQRREHARQNKQTEANQSAPDNEGQEIDAAQEKRSARGKKKKKTEAEAAVQLKALPKAMKEVYTGLAKQFHPDLEADESEKLRKTAIMQEITSSYEKGDFYNLLRMQLELNHTDAAFSEKKLNDYIQLLKKQAEQINLSLSLLKSPSSPFKHYHKYFHCHTFKSAEKRLKQRSRELEYLLMQKKHIVDMCKTAEGIKKIAAIYTSHQQ